MPEETARPRAASAEITFDPLDPASVAAAAAANLTFTRAPDFKTIFSDLVRYRIGNGVINLSINKTTHAPGVHMLGNIVEEHTEVVMSWVQFKMIVQNLTSILAAIETEVGPIPTPRTFRVNDEGNRAIVRTLGLTLSPNSDAPPRAESD